jgi:putative transposase
MEEGSTLDRRTLRDDQWERIAPLLPGKATDCGVTARDNRLFLEAVFWIARTGAPWRDLPAEFGRWHSVYMRFARWADKGVWDRVLDAVSADRDFEDVMLDSTALRAHQHAAGAQKNTARRLWAVLAADSAPKFTPSSMPSATRSVSR